MKLSDELIPKLKEYYKKKNWDKPFETIPEWLVIRYEGGVLKYIKRYNDSPSLNEIYRRIDLSQGKTMKLNIFRRYHN